MVYETIGQNRIIHSNASISSQNELGRKPIIYYMLTQRHTSSHLYIIYLRR